MYLTSFSLLPVSYYYSASSKEQRLSVLFTATLLDPRTVPNKKWALNQYVYNEHRKSCKRDIVKAASLGSKYSFSLVGHVR